MLPLKAFCVLGMTAMTAVIGWALLTQPPGAVSEYFANVWGVVSMVDLYTGFVIFSAWIWSRESSTGKAVAWTIAMMTTGWLAGCAYCLQAAVQENPPCPPANVQHTAVGTPEGAMQPDWALSPENVASLQASGDWNKFMLGKRFQPLAYGGLRS